MSNIKELIRAEIERRRKELEEQIVDIYDSKAVLRKDELQRLLSFLDTLPDEPVTDFHDLEKAAENSWAVYEYRESPKGLYSTCYVDGFIAGAEWQKAKMMKGAMEGEVCILPGNVAYVKEKNNESLKQYLLDNFKAGDEVRIIILQKEDAE